MATVACIWASNLCAEPASHQCRDPLIRIADPASAEKVCAIAASADERFAALGLTHNREISIVVTEDLDVAPGHCVALYSIGTAILQVLPIDCLADAPGRLGPFPRFPPRSCLKA